jgi:hypothetical protein
MSRPESKYGWWQGRRGDVPPPSLAELGPVGGLDLALEALAVAGIVVTIALVSTSWGRLPETIPTHFGLDGKADAYGGKATLLVLPAMAAAIFVALTALAAYPRMLNMPWRITPENRLVQYRGTLSFLRFVKAWEAWLFAALAWMSVSAAAGTGSRAGPGPWFPVAAAAIPLAGLVWYLWTTWRAR